MSYIATKDSNFVFKVEIGSSDNELNIISDLFNTYQEVYKPLKM